MQLRRWVSPMLQYARAWAARSRPCSAALRPRRRFELASSLFDLVRSPTNDGSILNDVGSLVRADSPSPMMGLGSSLTGLLYGGRTSTFTNSLAGYAGIKSSSASTLLNVAAPLVLAFIGRHARNDGLNATSLATLLRNQKHSYAAAVPVWGRTSDVTRGRTLKSVRRTRPGHLSGARRSGAGCCRRWPPMRRAGPADPVVRAQGTG